MSADDYTIRRCWALRWDGLRVAGEASAVTTHIEDHWAKIAGVKVTRLDGQCKQEEKSPASERQVGGDHYRKHKIQPWDIWDEYDLDRYLANAVKYLLRAGDKGPKVEDLRKALHYIEKAIEREESNG